MKSLILLLLVSISLCSDAVAYEGYTGIFLSTCPKGVNPCEWIEVSFDDYYNLYKGHENDAASSLKMLIKDNAEATYWTENELEWKCFDDTEKCNCAVHTSNNLKHCKPDHTDGFTNGVTTGAVGGNKIHITASHDENKDFAKAKDPANLPKKPEEPKTKPEAKPAKPDSKPAKPDSKPKKSSIQLKLGGKSKKQISR
jgi:hypothetical protein